MAKLHRIWRLASFSLIAKVLAGASAGVILALALHPRSRPLVMDGLRPTPAVLEQTPWLPTGQPGMPDPTNLDLASLWLSNYLLQSAEKRPFTQDQLLLLAEISQASRKSDPANSFWPQVEGLVQHDLKNESKSLAALSASTKLPTWRLRDAAWRSSIKEALADWSGRTCLWHDEAVSSGPTLRVVRALLVRLGDLGKPGMAAAVPIVSGLDPEIAAQAGIPSTASNINRSSWAVWRVAYLLKACLGSALFLLLVFARGRFRQANFELWALAGCLALLLQAAAQSLMISVAFFACAAVYLAPACGSHDAEADMIAPATAALLIPPFILSGAFLGHGAFAYLQAAWAWPVQAASIVAVALLTLWAVRAKTRFSPEQADLWNWSVFRAIVWTLGACLLLAAASGAAGVILEQNLELLRS